MNYYPTTWRLDMQGIDLGDRLERYLDLTSAQMKLTAGNMANRRGLAKVVAEIQDGTFGNL